MNADDLLIECADALRNPLWDGSERGDHLARIAEALADPEIANEVAELLRSAANSLRGQASVRHPFDVGKGGEGLADAIETALGPRRYVYHGTILGRLASIAKSGLMPDQAKVWRGRVPDEWLSSSVFFTTTWRGAMNWAAAARGSAKGPREGRYRRSVVLRLPAEGLALQPDLLAVSRGNLRVTGPAPIVDASVLVGEVRGFPAWVSLNEAVHQGTGRLGRGASK